MAKIEVLNQTNAIVEETLVIQTSMANATYRGPRGEKGEPFKYEDFTPEQLESLRGPSGKDGAIGPAGPVGPRGEVGPTGPIGLTGPEGPMGPAGPRGETGLTGPQGPVGLKGDAGPAGPSGKSGVYIGETPGEDDLVWINPNEEYVSDYYTKEEIDNLLANLPAGEALPSAEEVEF